MQWGLVYVTQVRGGVRVVLSKPLLDIIASPDELPET